MNFADRVKHAREHAKLTQVQLSERINKLFGETTSQQTISKIEAGAESSAFTAHIAAVCGVSAVWLAAEKGPMVILQAAEPAGRYSADSAQIENLRDCIELIEEALPPTKFKISAKDRADTIFKLYSMVADDGSLPMAEVVKLVKPLKAKIEEGQSARSYKKGH